MKIITEITGSAENRIIYEDGGKTGVFALPSIFGMDETRRQLKEAFAKERSGWKPDSETAEPDPAAPPEPAEETPVLPPRRKQGTKGGPR